MSDQIIDIGERLSDHAQDHVDPQPRAFAGLQAGCAFRLAGMFFAATACAVGLLVAVGLAPVSVWLAAPLGLAVAAAGAWSSLYLTNALVRRTLTGTLNAIEAPYAPGGIGGATPTGIPAIGLPPKRRRRLLRR